VPETRVSSGAPTSKSVINAVVIAATHWSTRPDA